MYVIYERKSEDKWWRTAAYPTCNEAALAARALHNRIVQMNPSRKNALNVAIRHPCTTTEALSPEGHWVDITDDLELH